ncbi:MAG: hypothetical protein GW771_00585 [Flavobacteriia bacterium]|nr:hypothetical protein [Flavobacteriia bacterium]
MKLLIPKEKAIQILQDRISGLNAYDFNAEAWKERTVLDLKEIFPLGSTQYLKIQFLRFDTYVVADKQRVFLEAQKTAEQVLKSYIEFINEYSKVAEERKVIKEKDFETKYYDLLKERNEIVTDYNGLIKNYEEQLDTNSELLDQTENLNNQIEIIRRDTIQIDNVSFSKLSNAFLNLPVWQIVTTFSVIIAIIIGVFGLGSIFQKNEANTQIFDFKTEIKTLKDEKEINNKTLYDKDKELKEMKSLVDSLTTKPKK